MDDEFVRYTALILLGGAIGIFSIASYTILKAQKYWASLLAFVGSFFALVAWLLLLTLILSSESGNYTLANSKAYLITAGTLGFIGISLSLLSLVGLCARFKGSNKRLQELEQITSILRNELNA